MNEKIAAGHDVINLGQGNPDQPTPGHIVDAMTEAVRNPENHKYSSFRGSRSLKQAAAEFYKGNTASCLTLIKKSPYCSEEGGACRAAAMPLESRRYGACSRPGLSGLLVRRQTGKSEHGNDAAVGEKRLFAGLQPNSSTHKGKSEAHVSELSEQPDGSPGDAGVFAETVSLAKTHGICVVHDFAYGAIGYDGQKPVSFLETDGAKEAGIEIYTLSKTYNMAGWRVGFAAGNASVIEALNLYQDHMYVSLFKAVQDAAAVALLSDQSCVKEQNERYEKDATFG